MKKITIILFLALLSNFAKAQGYGMCWNKLGNTMYSGQYFGSNNNLGFDIKTNGVRREHIDTNFAHTFFGSGTQKATFGQYIAQSKDGQNMFFGGYSKKAGTGSATSYKGTANTSYGRGSLDSITEGYENTAIGHNTLSFATTGFSNVAIGHGSIYFATTGSSNTGLGNLTLLYNVTGSGNTAIGHSCLNGFQGHSFSNNTVIGNSAGGIRNGNTNIVIGYRCGNPSPFTYGLRSNDNCIMIGNSIAPVDSISNNLLNIGNIIFGTDIDGVNTTVSTGSIAIGGQPVTSSELSVISTTKGFLPPVMTATQGSAIATPTEGLLIYVTNTNGTFTAKGWWGYDGAAWQKLNN